MPEIIALARPKRLLIVAHAPSVNTLRMRDAVAKGAAGLASGQLDIVVTAPLDAGPDDVLGASAIILGTPENLGYMSGAMKDFFDRIYYPCLEAARGLSYGLYIRAGQSAGDGALRGLHPIVTGLKWKAMQEPVICCGPFDEAFIGRCETLGETIAAGLDIGLF